ncbi:MAG: sigma-70 family RNA polymerase sigma factor [Planctomycetota bacterium]
MQNPRSAPSLVDCHLRFLAGDPAGFEDLHSALFDPLLRHAARHDSRGHANDVVGEAFLRYLVRARSLDFAADAQLKKWFLVVVSRLCLPSRRSGRKMMGQDELSAHPARIEAADNGDLEAALERLTPAQRAITRLWLEDYSMAEIADALGFSSSKAHRHWRRAKERLGDLLGDNDDTCQA